METENKAKLDYELTDYGTLLFEYNSIEKTNVLYVSSEKRKANYKSPLFYLLLSVALIMIAWFLASIIKGCMLKGDQCLLRVGLSLGSLLPMGISINFIIKTCFGLWGDLYNLKLHNLKEEYLRVYEEYIVIKKDDAISVFSRPEIKSIYLRWSHNVTLNFDDSYQSFTLDIPFSVAAAEKLNKIFGNKIHIHKSKRFMEPVCANPLSQILIELAFAFAALGMGIGLICMRIYANVDVPFFLAAMFISGGVVAVCATFSFIPIIKDIFMPFAFAGMLTVVPWWMAIGLHQIMGVAEGIEAITYFTPFSCIALLLSAVGLLLIVTGFVAIIDYIRYGHKLGKL